MPWNLLIIPLVGGYFFLTRSYFFRYKYRLLDRQRLLFESVIAATFLLVASYTIILLLKPYIAEHYLAIYLKYRPFPYTGTAVLSLVMFLVVTYLPNIFLSKEKSMKEAIRSYGTALERLVLEALENPQQICFTLDNGKVYVGYPNSINDLVNSGTLSFFPVFSGYRDDQQDIVIVTFYDKFYLNLSGEDLFNDDLNFEQLIAVDHIISAKRFDIEVYDKFSGY